MNSKINNILTPTAAAASLLFLGACEEDVEESSASADLLIGEWELVTIDGETPEDGDEYSYSIFFKFEADGDLEFCYNYMDKVNPSESYEDCYDGEWSWVSKGEELNMGWSDTYENEEGVMVTYETDIDFKITKLTQSELEGNWTDTDEDEVYEVVFKKR